VICRFVRLSKASFSMTDRKDTVPALSLSDRDPYSLGIWICLGSLAIICAALWLLGGRTYFVKSVTESHNMILAAVNIRDLLTFVVQDVAASPDPAAHPFWYIHHPNLVAKTISYGLGRLGFGLQGQVGIMLALNVAGLAFVVAAFSRFSRASAVAALIVAATSYGSFHYSAGDLCRGPLYLLLWPFLYALIHNDALSDRGKNLVIGSISALSILSDWGFALFVVTLAFCWTNLGRGRPAWRWYLLVVALPTVGSFLAYEAAVISAVGWDFFLFDAKVTYLGRLGVGDYVDYRAVLDRFRENSVVVWQAQGKGTLSVSEMVGEVVIKPLLNTGPVWILSMPMLVCATATVFARIGWGRVAWSIIGLLVGLNLLAILPMPVLLPVAAAIAIGLAQVRIRTATERLCGLAAALVLAVIVPAIIFPGYTIGFLIGGGRPPFPLLEMSGAALLAQLSASGQLARWLTRMAAGGGLARRIFASTAYGVWALVAVLIATAVSITQLDDALLGVSKGVAIGLAIAMAGVPLIAVAESISYIRTRRYPLENGADATRGRFRLRRWGVPAFLVLTTLVLASHVSDNASVFGRYSLKYAAFLMAPALLSLVAVLSAAFPTSANSLWNITRRFLDRLSWGGVLGGSPAAQCIQVTMAMMLLGQIGWFMLSIAGHPPRPIAYAALLEQPEYRGKSFLTTSYDGIAWYSTRGWAYMSPVNPPKLNPIGSRFRHLADWRNEAKYSHPDYFLCDNGEFAFVPPGAVINDAPAGLNCSHCTCKNVAAILRAAGHDVVVDRDDFSIVKFNWRGQ
jgi:hypothetical protein